MDEDSELVKHFACNKVTPNSKLNWITDYGMVGGIMGISHIVHIVMKNYIQIIDILETKEKTWMGYMIIRVNTITVNHKSLHITCSVWIICRNNFYIKKWTL